MAHSIDAEDQVVARITRRANPDVGLAEGPMVVEMAIHGGRLLARVGKDRHVEVQFGIRLTGQQEQAGALDSRTEIEDVKLFHALFSAK
jgi:hypothetical protein